MATVLLLVIYLAFIGLGIPDSLFGAAWPAIYKDFAVPLSSANYLTLLLSCGSVISSLYSAKLINKLGTPFITAASTVITAFALLGYSVSGNIWIMCLCAIPLGLGAGAIDSALNNYVALYYNAMHMNFLHCFYGVGVSLSPYLLSLVISGESGWRGGYLMMFWIQLGISALTILTLPLWKRAHSNKTQIKQEVTPKTLTLKQVFQLPGVYATSLAFLSSCAIEVTCGIWGSTFLVNSKGMSIDGAAKIITLYYAGIAVGRFLSGILSVKLSSWKIIFIGTAVLGVALIILMLPLHALISGIGLFLIGLGNAPLFPNLVHLTPKNFGEDVSQSVTSAQMAVAYIGITFTPPLFGLIAQYISIDLFPYYMLLMFVLLVASLILAPRTLKKIGRY